MPNGIGYITLHWGILQFRAPSFSKDVIKLKRVLRRRCTSLDDWIGGFEFQGEIRSVCTGMKEMSGQLYRELQNQEGAKIGLFFPPRIGEYKEPMFKVEGKVKDNRQ